MEDPVWLVDDMVCALEVIRLFLEKKGISTVIYNCPLKALHDLEQGQMPQLIVTDFCMPEMSGTEFLDAVHSIIPNMPAIIITGDPSQIPSHYAHIPIIEKGQLSFINDLLQQIQKMETLLFARKGLKKENMVPKTSVTNVSVISKRKKPPTESKHSLPGKNCACL